MNSYTFASDIVVPTVKEALADRGDRRRAYIASIVTYCLVDYIAAEIGRSKTEVRGKIQGVCKPAFDVVRGVCNGTKHAGSTRGYRFNPGEERTVPVFVFDTPGVGWGHGRLNVPGLSVENNSEQLFLDTCCQVVLLCLCNIYNDQLGNLDLSFMDRVVLEAKPFGANWGNNLLPGPTPTPAS
jgi:hypothetical protein